jgi:RNA polymerase sigma factor (sigma-70 family)
MGDASLGNINEGMRGDGSHASFGRNMAAPRNVLLLHSASKEGNSEMTGPTPFVFVIDDDESVRKGLKRLLRSANYESEVFKSASDFLARPPHPGPACVIVDVQMPGIDGIDFQQALIQRRREEQLVFISGYGTIPMCTRVMKAGAVDFLPKPFNSRELLKCVEDALHRSAEQRRRAAERDGARRLLDLLTPREFEVMQLLITGMLNKQIGSELGVAEKTVKVHRGRLMKKLRVTSVAELVQLVQKAEVPPSAGNETKV